MYAFEASAFSRLALSFPCRRVADFCPPRSSPKYLPGNDGYISWFADDKHAWTYKAAGMGPNADAEVSMRPVPQEPMVSRFERVSTRLPLENLFTDLFVFPSVHPRQSWDFGELRSCGLRRTRGESSVEADFDASSIRTDGFRCLSLSARLAFPSRECITSTIKYCYVLTHPFTVSFLQLIDYIRVYQPANAKNSSSSISFASSSSS